MFRVMIVKGFGPGWVSLAAASRCLYTTAGNRILVSFCMHSCLLHRLYGRLQCRRTLQKVYPSISYQWGCIWGACV